MSQQQQQQPQQQPLPPEASPVVSQEMSPKMSQDMSPQMSAGQTPGHTPGHAPARPAEPSRSALLPCAVDRYSVEHETRYAYTAPVSQSWQLARLTPRNLPWQRVLSHGVQIDPPPDERMDTTDSFGNAVTHFGLHGAHRQLRVRMQCQVEVGDRPALGSASASASVAGMGMGMGMGGLPSVDAVRESIRRGAGFPIDLTPAQMTEPTALLPWSAAAFEYAEASLQPDRPWCEAVDDLMRRIHADFEFDAHATTVSTSVDEVLQHRRGVCQDFAHLMLACLRGHGLAARYVSGYLLTEPAPGMPRLLGVDASHAWVAVFLPGHGWVEYDPTNCQLADRRHITLAWGADFADVVPLRGVILGGGAMQQMDVTVSVIPHG